MDENMIAYRQKHKRCKYCQYYRARTLPIPFSPEIKECLLKDKKIDYENIPRFCKEYEVKNGRATEG